MDGDWKYMLMGSGLPAEIDEVRNKISERGLEDRVILPGFIEWEDMPAHWNAADCMIHFTQTTESWEETFSLSLVQAMAVKLPVIGSTSGLLSLFTECQCKALSLGLTWWPGQVQEGNKSVPCEGLQCL